MDTNAARASSIRVASLHNNIDFEKAREVAREYARAIRDQSNGNYLHYSTKCRNAFPDHNHIVKCSVEYQNAKDTAAGVYTCKETIELFMKPNGSPGRRGPDIYDIFANHTSFLCGSRKLKETPMG